MSFLRFLSLAILVVWVGGLTVLGAVAAPVVFAVIQAHDPATGRVLAGEVFGTMLQRFQVIAWVLGGLLMAVLGARAMLGPRPRRLAVQMSLISAMLAASLYTGLVLTPRIDEIRTATSGPVATLSDGDPIKVEFGRLHGLANGLMGFSLVAGLSLVWLNMGE